MKSLYSILSIAIAAALFFFFINPFYKDIKDLDNDIGVYTKALGSSSDLQKAQDSLIDQYKQIKREDKDKLNHLVPNSVDNIELILEIEKIANLYGMPIEDIRFDSKSLEENNVNNSVNVIASPSSSSGVSYGVFPMEFSVEGKYSTFVSFLKELERNLRVIDVKSISFSSSSQVGSKNGEGSDIYVYSLKVQTYWLK